MGVRKSGDAPRVPNEELFEQRRAESAANLTGAFIPRRLEKDNKANGTGRMYNPTRGTDPWGKYFKGLAVEHLPSGGKTDIAGLRAFNTMKRHPTQTRDLPPSKKTKRL
jgi:hypothetical protein